MRTQATSLIIATVFCLAAIAAFGQGELIPLGPPAPTMKTLEQVEPRIDLLTLAGDASSEIRITDSGSYYLSGNLAVNKTQGIHIDASGVTLDLNGFEISRVSGSGGYGIRIFGGKDRTTIRNGTVTGFSYGIHNSSPYAKGCQFENLAVSGCSSYGIRAGVASRILDCRAHDNGGIGIYASDGSSISGCTAWANQGIYGIYADDGSSISGCTAYNNEGTYGIYAGSGSSISGCAASHNQVSYGIFTGPGSSISGCTAHNNQCVYSIYASEGSTITGCEAYSNDGIGAYSSGIGAADGCVVIQCAARANSATNSPSTNQQGAGIIAFGTSTVKDCLVCNNGGDGIHVRDDSLVSGNTCDRNGNGGDGAGIFAALEGNRIDGNTVTDNDRGIEVNAVGNLIIRNSASGNSTNYNIAADNRVGVIVAAPLSGAISGNTGGAGVGTSNPWANFSF